MKNEAVRSTSEVFDVSAPPDPRDANFHEVWLRYRPVEGPRREEYRTLIQSLVMSTAGSPPELLAAQEELQRGLSGMLGGTFPAQGVPGTGSSLIVGTPESSEQIRALGLAEGTGEEGYVIRSVEVDGVRQLVVASEGAKGAMYGAFHLLRLMQTGQSLEDVDVRGGPKLAQRMVNHWDSYTGGTERGYAGESIFDFASLPKIEQRYIDYARMLASTGVNALVLNNVNADPRFLDSETLDGIAALEDVFGKYGIKLYLSVSWESPRVLGGIDNLDPLNPEVQAWWDAKAKELMEKMPNFGGLLVKADSEGQPGPKQYGRNHAEGANVLARALAKATPEGDEPPLVVWRAFVWHREGGDRAKNAFDEFQPLDGQFDDNVVLQIKHGPLDFQVREPVSPLLGTLKHTRMILELQVTQEYTGQATHAVYLPAFWKNEVLDFDIDGDGGSQNVGTRIEGIAGVRNVGWDPENPNWTGHPLAAANTYAFGRLAWDPSADPEALAEEWVRMTFGDDPEVVKVTTSLLNRSWKTYEDYTSPLGVGFMSEGWKEHYDPLPEVKQQYHRADAHGVGYDRVASGYLDQYPPDVAALYRDPKTCPDEQLLFFHHVPYEHVLHSGKTVIQHIYDSRFEGVEEVRRMRAEWAALEGRMDPRRHAEVLTKLDAQLEHATMWRDSLATYFLETSGRQDDARQWVGVRRIQMGDGQATLKLVNNTPGPQTVTVRVRSNGIEGEHTVVVPPTTAPGGVTTVKVPFTGDATGTPTFEVLSDAVGVIGPRQPMVVTKTGDLEVWTPPR